MQIPFLQLIIKQLDNVHLELIFVEIIHLGFDVEADGVLAFLGVLLLEVKHEVEDFVDGHHFEEVVHLRIPVLVPLHHPKLPQLFQREIMYEVVISIRQVVVLYELPAALAHVPLIRKQLNIGGPPQAWVVAHHKEAIFSNLQVYLHKVHITNIRLDIALPGVLRVEARGSTVTQYQRPGLVE